MKERRDCLKQPFDPFPAVSGIGTAQKCDTASSKMSGGLSNRQIKSPKSPAIARLFGLPSVGSVDKKDAPRTRALHFGQNKSLERELAPDPVCLPGTKKMPAQNVDEDLNPQKVGSAAEAS